jgi:dynein heavy chain, axonemal
MNSKNIQKLKTLCAHPDFQKEKIFKVSEPAGNISLWIKACVETYEALLVVEPKRQ